MTRCCTTGRNVIFLQSTAAAGGGQTPRRHLQHAVLLGATSQGDQVWTYEIAAGHDQRICFSSIQKEKERKKTWIIRCWLLVLSSKSEGVDTQQLGSPYDGVRSQRSDQVISAQEVQHLYFLQQPLLAEILLLRPKPHSSHRGRQGRLPPHLLLIHHSSKCTRAGAILSRTVESAAGTMALPRPSPLQLEAGHCHRLTGTSTSRDTGSGPCKEQEEEKKKKGLFGGDVTTHMPGPWGPGRHSKGWPRPGPGPATLQWCPGRTSWQWQHLPRGVPQVRPATEAEASLREGSATPGLSRGSPRQAGEAGAPAGRRGGGEGSGPDKTHRRGEPDSVGAFYFKSVGCWVVGFSFPLST